MPAAVLQRDRLESLLRLRKFDHTLATSFNAEPADPRWLVPTGICALDQRLAGGFPRGHVSEICGPRSTGHLTVMVSALAGATARGEAVALIDPLDMFDPVSASANGIDFERMLWVRGEPCRSSRVSLSCEYGTWQKHLDRAVKALNIVLQAGGFGLVVLDLAEMAPRIIKRLPCTTWLRLHRVIDGSETACVLIGSEPIGRSVGGVTIQLASGSRPEAGSPKPEASQIHARVVRSRALNTDHHVCVSVLAPAC
jgi:hypothetical protein